MLSVMLVPRWILGGILTATLGLTGGLAARAEAPPPPGATFPSPTPDDAIDAQLRVVAMVSAPQNQSWTKVRPSARPAGLVQTAVRISRLRPMAREEIMPTARWDARPDAALWTRATLSAINAQRYDLSDVIPHDIAEWCPAYSDNPERLRDAFWVGILSALAKYESGLNPSATGGGGRYYGLLQISPATARSHDCGVSSGQALHDPEENLACAARIISATVNRDDAVALYDGRWRGVAADWGPMTNSDMRAEMSAWTRDQDYCVISTAVLSAPIPRVRPWTLTEAYKDIPITEAIQLAMLSNDVSHLRTVQ